MYHNPKFEVYQIVVSIFLLAYIIFSGHFAFFACVIGIIILIMLLINFLPNSRKNEIEHIKSDFTKLSQNKENKNQETIKKDDYYEQFLLKQKKERIKLEQISKNINYPIVSEEVRLEKLKIYNNLLEQKKIDLEQKRKNKNN